MNKKQHEILSERLSARSKSCKHRRLKEVCHKESLTAIYYVIVCLVPGAKPNLATHPTEVSVETDMIRCVFWI